MQDNLSPSSSNAVPQDEIDLIGLFVNIVRFLTRRFTAILLTILISISISAVLFFALPPEYKTRLIAKSRVLTDVEIKGIIYDLNELVKDGNSTEIGNRMKIDYKLANQLTKVKSFGIKELDNKDVSTQRDSVFVIEVYLRDNTQLDKLQKGLVNYLENNEFVKQRVAVFKEARQKELEKLTFELRNIDSTKTLIIRQLQNKANNVSFIDLGTLYQQALQYYQRQLFVKESLQFADNLQIIVNFTRFEKKFITLPIALAIGLGVGIILGIFIGLYLDVKPLVEQKQV